jgi:hypothetical protein
VKPRAAAHLRDPHTSAAVDPQSEVLRELLVKADLTMSGAARLLEMSENVLRGYCTGDRVPRVVMLAMERLAEMEQQVTQARGPEATR